MVRSEGCVWSEVRGVYGLRSPSPLFSQASIERLGSPDGEPKQRIEVVACGELREGGGRCEDTRCTNDHNN